MCSSWISGRDRQSSSPCLRLSAPCAHLLSLKNCDSSAASDALGEIARGQINDFSDHQQKRFLGAWSYGRNNRKRETLRGELLRSRRKKSETLIVSAKSKSGVGLYAVDVSNSQVEIETDLIVDLTRDQAHVYFNGANCTEIATEVEGEAVLTRSLPSILTIISADMVGAGEVAFTNNRGLCKNSCAIRASNRLFSGDQAPIGQRND